MVFLVSAFSKCVRNAACSKIYFLFFITLFPTVYAQVKNIGLPEITNYKRSEYLGGTQNWNIDQDKNGNIYFANNNGLFQFNGTSWNSYKLPNNTSIRSLKIAEDQRIYVGGYNEFGYFEADKNGILRYYSLAKLVNDESKNQIDFIWKLHLYKGAAFFQSFEKLYIYDGKKLKILEAPSRFQFSFEVNDRL